MNYSTPAARLPGAPAAGDRGHHPDGYLGSRRPLRVECGLLGTVPEGALTEHDGDLHFDDGTAAYRHCPRCGGVLEERTVVPHEPPRLVCGACRFVFYVDPKVAVGAICETPEGIVLLRRGIEPGRGKWVFPGGYVDRGETLEGAARREAREEIGTDVRIDHLVNVYSYAGRPVVVIVYAARILGGTPCAGEEALEVRSFSPGGIPWDDLAFRSTREGLRDYLDGRRAGGPKDPRRGRRE